MKNLFARSLVFLLPVLTLCGSAVLAQLPAIGQTDRQTGSSMITTVPLSEREVLIDVQIWGQVNKPGMYKVPVSTDVVGLISYASGPTDFAALGRIKLVRGGVPRGTTIKLNLDSYTSSGDRGLVPMLEAGDVVIVPTTRAHIVSLFTGFISQVALVVTSYIVIVGRK